MYIPLVSQASTLADGVDENVVEITTSFVGGESSETLVDNELTLVVERLSIVIADVDLLLGVVKERL